MADTMKCNACFAAFPSLEAIKEHYRTEWHCLNAKRRGQGLAPLKREQFLALPKKPKAAGSKATASRPGSSPQKAAKPVSQEPAKEEQAAEPAEASEEVGEEAENAPADAAAEREEAPLPLGANISVFDNKELPTMEDCVQYMAEQFGFFIPDIEYLVDQRGLLEYVGEKVKLGHICLYCQKRFSSGRACQNHMISKSHCKIAYDEGIDGEEFDGFYDFSSTYEDLDEVEVDSEGEVQQEELEHTRTGELQLPDGRVLGHRQFRVYYKQYYRPADSRAPILAQQREELLRLGTKFGGNEWSVAEVSTMTDNDVMTNIIKYQKEIRKGQLIEQRAIKRQEHSIRRKEYKRTVDQLRSGENTTAKIRDYHRMLV